MIEFHRLFCEIAANTGHCLSEASYARSVGGSAFCKTAVNGIRFSDSYLYFYMYLYAKSTVFKT